MSKLVFQVHPRTKPLLSAASIYQISAKFHSPMVSYMMI